MRSARRSTDPAKQDRDDGANPALVAMSAFASNARLAWCVIHLRRYLEGCSAFGRAAHWALEFLTRSMGMTDVHRERGTGLVFALLSGDIELEVGTLQADAPLAFEGKWPTRRCYFQALEALVVGDNDVARDAAAELTSIPEKRVVRQKFFPGVGEAVLAILDKDSLVLRKALGRVLEQHQRFARGMGYLANSAEGLVSEPATCLAILARRAGIDVAVDTRYHQAKLRFKAAYLEEFKGQPIRMTPFQLTADLLPLGYVEAVLERSGSGSKD